MASQLLELATSRALCRQLGERARQRALGFDVDVILPRLAGILEGLLPGSAPPLAEEAPYGKSGSWRDRMCSLICQMWRRPSGSPISAG